MRLTQEWFHTIAEDEEGRSVYLNGRTHLTPFLESGKYPYRIEVRYRFVSDKGFPEGNDLEYIEKVDELLPEGMEKDKMAILTGNHLTAEYKIWVFYSRTDQVFFERLNTILSPFPQLPLEFVLESDPEWDEYRDMLQLNPEFPEDE